MKVVNGSGDIVALLEETLEHARAGELNGLAVVVSTETEGIITGWTWRDGVNGWPLLVAGTQMLAHELMSTDELI